MPYMGSWQHKMSRQKQLDENAKKIKKREAGASTSGSRNFNLTGLALKKKK